MSLSLIHISVEAVEQLAGPEFHLGGGVPGADLIGPHLVGHVHDEVPVHHAVDQMCIRDRCAAVFPWDCLLKT